MKIKSAILFLAFPVVANLSAQQDPEAKKILDSVSEKVKNSTSIQSDFELTIENKPENQKSSSKGKIRIKGKKYYMESMGTKVYFNGTTMWSYLEDDNEVTITRQDELNDDFIENPAIIFDFYNRDFKYRLIGEVTVDNIWMYEIDLYPNNLEQPYSRFKILIRRDEKQLYMIKAMGKNGVDYTVKLTNVKYDLPMSDSLFEFDPSKHKGIEVIDLRF